MARKRPSDQKRQREYQKKQREREKAEKAMRKRERRDAARNAAAADPPPTELDAGESPEEEERPVSEL